MFWSKRLEKTAGPAAEIWSRHPSQQREGGASYSSTPQTNDKVHREHGYAGLAGHGGYVHCPCSQSIAPQTTDKVS